MLLVAERTNPIAVQVERTEPDRPDVEREPEHGARTGLHGRTAEGQPPMAGRGAMVSKDSETATAISSQLGRHQHVRYQGPEHRPRARHGRALHDRGVVVVLSRP